MALLLDGVTEDTEATPVPADGPVHVTVTGNLGGGTVFIYADIGIGDELAYSYSAGDTTSFERLEFTIGVTYTAKLVGSNGDNTDVTVASIPVT